MLPAFVVMTVIGFPLQLSLLAVVFAGGAVRLVGAIMGLTGGRPPPRPEDLS